MAQSYDYVIRGGTVVDGSGESRYVADVAIQDGKIVKIGALGEVQANHYIDASDKMIVPGFIDVHGHADDQQGHWRGMRSDDPLRRAATAHVSQGITTSVANSDGLAPFLPLKDQIAKVERNPFALNLAYMVSINRTRYAVMGENTPREANAEEIDLMQALISQDMDAGAWGMAAVLEMRDGHYTTTRELIGMTKALKPYDGVFIAHPRSQSKLPSWWLPSAHGKRTKTDYPWAPSMFEASEELIQIAEKNSIRVSISHISMRGPDPDKDVVSTVNAVNAAREKGIKIYADQHVYRANPFGIFFATGTGLGYDEGGGISQFLYSSHGTSQKAEL